MKKGRQLEHIEQAQVVEWALAREVEGNLQGIENLFAVPNGGLRHIRVALEMIRDGLKKGVPDLFLSAARGGHFGLYIEMKYGKGKLSPEQIIWHDRLKSENYRVETCYTAMEAKFLITSYLQSPKTKGSI